MDSVKLEILREIHTPEQQEIIYKINELIHNFDESYNLPGLKKYHVNIQGKSYYMDLALKANLDDLKLAVKNKWDGVFVLDGMEGSGKTKFAKSILYYLTDGRFKITDIFFTPEQFEQWVDQAQPGDGGLWDEFVLGGMSEEALTRMQISIVKKMTLIRKKRLYIALLIPYFFMLKSYFAVARARFLLHVTSPDGIQRGYFRFYNYKQKRQLYFKNKKNWSYDGVAASFHGRFTNYEGMFVNEDEYEEKKDSAIEVINTKDNANKWREKCLTSAQRIWSHKEEYPKIITQDRIADWFDITNVQLRRWINDRTY